MSRGQPPSRRGHPPDGVGNLDPETLRQVQRYLASRNEHRPCALAGEAAWRRFHRACDPLLRKLAACRCRGCWSPEDRVQDLWCALILRLPCYDPARERFAGWLGTVLRRALADQDRAGHALARLDDGLERLIPSREDDPLVACERAEARMIVETAARELRCGMPETTYQIVWAHWVEGKSFQEIAEVVGLPAELVRDRHQRAIGRLRAILMRRI